MNKKKTWIDPPEGWRYGFPRVFDWNDQYETLSNWFIRNGYPEKDINFALTYSRQWDE